MGAAYSQDLRDRIVAARQRGMKTRQVATLFKVSPAWVRRVMQRLREHGEASPRPRGGATVIKIDLARLRELVEQQPDATIAQLHACLGVACSQSAIGTALKRLGFTFKKGRSMPPSRIARTSLRSGSNGNNNSPSSPRHV